MQVEIIIHYLKQNNLYLSFPSNMQIISQEQLNVDIFSSQESWSGAAPRMRTSSPCLCCKYLQYLQYWQIFGHPNTMLDGRANSNIILHTNIRVCPNTVYSNAGFKTPALSSVKITDICVLNKLRPISILALKCPFLVQFHVSELKRSVYNTWDTQLCSSCFNQRA